MGLMLPLTERPGGGIYTPAVIIVIRPRVAAGALGVLLCLWTRLPDRQDTHPLINLSLYSILGVALPTAAQTFTV